MHRNGGERVLRIGFNKRLHFDLTFLVAASLKHLEAHLSCSRADEALVKNTVKTPLLISSPTVSLKPLTTK